MANRIVSLWRMAALSACLVFGAALFAGCNLGGDPGFVDDHKLNTDLIGTWEMTYTGGYDRYTVDADAITHGTKYPGGDGYEGGESSTQYTIGYVYNFSETAGCIIVKYTNHNSQEKYTAVYFRNLEPKKQVLMGSAYNVADYPQSVDVDSLDAAKEKFKPANAETYGGGSAQIGTPQLWK